MTTPIPSRRYGTATLAFAIASGLIYLVMIRLTLPQIHAISGHIAFDLRPFGYSPQDAAQLLGDLGQSGRRFYLTRQIPLDLFYPALLCATLVCAFLWFGQRLPATRPMPIKLVSIGIAFALGVMICDYAENLGILLMILNVAHLPDPLVYASSSATILKSAFTVAAVFCLLTVIVLYKYRPSALASKS